MSFDDTCHSVRLPVVRPASVSSPPAAQAAASLTSQSSGTSHCRRCMQRGYAASTAACGHAAPLHSINMAHPYHFKLSSTQFKPGVEMNPTKHCSHRERSKLTRQALATTHACRAQTNTCHTSMSRCTPRREGGTCIARSCSIRGVDCSQEVWS